ncbi:MAG: ABC transporter substrate-binding protein [Candidatus Firestonebacteria bacterium]|nr:ABC transporter substrate-binding protein [Candidatus Firestonebacteria bacterium]
MKKIILLLLTILFLLISSSLLFAQNIIRIGVAGPFSGSAAVYGEMLKAGVQLKADEINAKGGINGKKIELIFGDDMCDPKEAAAVGQKFASDKSIVIVIGHFCSSSTLAAKPIYKMMKLPAISPCSTNIAVCIGSDYMFRNVYRDDYQGEFMAQYVKNILNINKVAVFYDNDDYGIGLKDAFVNEAKKIGLNIQGIEAYTKDITDFTPQITKFKSLNTKSLFIAGIYNEAGLIANQTIKKLNMNIPILGADGMGSPGYIEVAGKKAAEGALASCPYTFQPGKDAEADKFAKTFLKKYGKEADWIAVNSYDALGIALKAIEAVGADREKIKNYLKNINSKENSYKGITGVTFFDKNGDCKKPAFVNVVRDGKWVAAEKQMQ